MNFKNYISNYYLLFLHCIAHFFPSRLDDKINDKNSTFPLKWNAHTRYSGEVPNALKRPPHLSTWKVKENNTTTHSSQANKIVVLTHVTIKPEEGVREQSWLELPVFKIQLQNTITEKCAQANRSLKFYFDGWNGMEGIWEWEIV